MFEAVGTMRTYLQQYQLKKSAKQKVKTGESFDWKDARSTFVKVQEPSRNKSKSFVELSLEKAKKDDERTVASKKSGITQKLRRGKKLSPQELEYLREHDEKLYKKAKTTMEEREKLERALKSAKTKAEAMRAVAIAYANAAAACTDSMDGGGAGAVAGAGGNAGAVEGGGASSFDAGISVNADASMSMEGGAAVHAEAGVASADVAATEAANVSGAEGNVAADNAAGTEAGASESAASADGMEDADETRESGEAASSQLAEAGDGGEFDDPLILLVLRHLQAAWQEFMKSKQYKALPEDETQAAKRLDTETVRRTEAVKAVSLTAVAAKYQTATLGEELPHLLGTVGAAE